jgi:hypothetical protein
MGREIGLYDKTVKGRNHWEDLSVERKTILKLNVKKCYV